MRETCGFILVALALTGGCATVAKVPPQSGKNTRQHVVNSLKETGVDVKSPCQFEMYLKFSTEGDANIAAGKMREFCQAAQVRPDTEEGKWSCVARKLLIPDSDETESVLYRAKEIASNLNGIVDSWEVDFGK